MPITREENQSMESFLTARERADAQARMCREEQNRLNALRHVQRGDKQADEWARKTLGRLRRKDNEIDPKGELPRPGHASDRPRFG